MAEKSITLSKREYEDLSRYSKEYLDYVKTLKIQVPEIVKKIVSSELEKFNKEKPTDVITWAESISYRIQCNGFYEDDCVLVESGYNDLLNRIETKIAQLGFFDKKAIEDYECLEENHNVIAEAFCSLVRPLYSELSDEVKKKIEGCYDSVDSDFDTDE